MTKKKTEFTWDKEVSVKVIEVNGFEKREVKVAEKNGKQFVCVATMKKIKDAWKPVKNATFPMDTWKEIVEAMGDWELSEAFNEFNSGNGVRIKNVGNTKVAIATEEPKLKGKKQSNFDPTTLGLPVSENIKYVDFPKITTIYVQGATRKSKAVKELEAMDKVVYMGTHKDKELGKMVSVLEYRK